MQGTAPAGSSGEWVQSLQAAAAQTIRAKSQRTETYLKELAELFFCVIRDELTVEELMAMCGKYSPAIWHAIKQGVKQIHLDVSAQVSSGSASNKQAETQMLLAMRGANVQVSDESILAKAGLDQANETQKILKSQRVMGMAAPAETGEGGDKKPGESNADSGSKAAA
jgi:hypothetical protein